MYFHFYISNNINMQLQSISKQSFCISLNCETRNLHTKQELQEHVLLTHKAMAKPQLEGYPELPWDLLGKRSQKPQSSIYSKYSGIFVAQISGHNVIKRCWIFKHLWCPLFRFYLHVQLIPFWCKLCCTFGSFKALSIAKIKLSEQKIKHYLNFLKSVLRT